MKPIKYGDEVIGYLYKKPAKVSYKIEDIANVVFVYGILTLIVVCIILTVK